MGEGNPVALPLHRLGSPAWPIRAMMFATAPPPSNLNSPSRLAADYPNNNWSRFLNRPGVEHAAGERAIRRRENWARNSCVTIRNAKAEEAAALMRESHVYCIIRSDLIIGIITYE